MLLHKLWGIAAAVVAVAALLALGPPARADFVVTISEWTGANGGGSLLGQLTLSQSYPSGTLTPTTGGSNSGSITNTSFASPFGTGAISLGYSDAATGTTVGGSAAAPGTATSSTGPSSGVPIVDTNQSTTNLVLGTGVGSVVISEAVNNLGPLTGPLGVMTSTLSNSLLQQGGSGANDTLQSYFDQNNGTSAGVGNNATGTQGPLYSGTPPGNTASSTVSISGNSPFALSNVFMFNGSSGDLIHETSTTTVTAQQVSVVPEPASLSLWISGLPVLSLIYFWRRRNRRPLAIP